MARGNVVDYDPGGRRGKHRGGGSGGRETGGDSGAGDSGGGAASGGDGYDLEALNREFAVISLGGKVRIMQQAAPISLGDDGLRFMGERDFKMLLANRWLPPAEDGGRRRMVANMWLGDPGRREYRGLVFAPEGAEDGVYNLWKGWAVAPMPGHLHQRFLAHIMENVARGDVALFDWVVGWFAHMVQKPTERPGTALVLRGLQGTGKTIIGKVMGMLCPDHYRLVDSPHYVVGRFNPHMASLLLLQCDEGVWAGDKEAEGRLKGLVTSDIQMVERKGIDAQPMRNLVRLLMSSNHDWVVPAGAEERRFCVLDMGDDHMQDHAYFGAIMADIEAGGLAHLLDYLLKFDLASVDVRRIPRTEALLDQKLESLDGIWAWWMNRLMEGSPTGRRDDWPDRVPKDEVYKDFVRDQEDQGVKRKLSRVRFGKALNRLAPGLVSVRSWMTVSDGAGEPGRQRQVWAYGLPDLAACRAAFEAMLGADGAIDWPGDGAGPGAAGAGDGGLGAGGDGPGGEDLGDM